MARPLRFAAGLTFAVLASLAALPAGAEFYAGEKSPKDPHVGVYLAFALEFKPIAEMFGCKFAWANANDGSSVQLEFVPAGDDVRKWTRLVTITTVALPPKEADRAAIVKRLQSIMTDNYKQHGKILATAEGVDAGSPTLFVEYEIGQGAAKEHNAAAVMKLRADLAGIVQVQSRGKPLAPEDIAKMRSFAKIKQN